MNFEKNKAEFGKKLNGFHSALRDIFPFYKDMRYANYDYPLNVTQI